MPFLFQLNYFCIVNFITVLMMKTDDFHISLVTYKEFKHNLITQLHVEIQINPEKQHFDKSPHVLHVNHVFANYVK